MAAAKPKTRSGTDTRQRQNLMAVRLLPEETEQIRAEAARRGVSMGEILRDALRTAKIVA